MGLSLPSPQWWTLTGESMQCYRLFCYKTISLPPPPPQFSIIPVSRLSQSPRTGLRQSLRSILPNCPFFLPPCHLAFIPSHAFSLFPLP